MDEIPASPISNRRLGAAVLSLGVLLALAFVGQAVMRPPDNSPTTPPNATPAPTQGEQTVSNDYEGDPRLVAPDFPPGVDWINVEAPLTMEALRGKVVLLDFWTYGCINCIHMIPVLEQLERAYPDELVVIGVHSAKFANEGETDNLRQIVQRYDLHHPVINDNEFRIWRGYGVRAWPTFALINPLGRVIAMQSGEIPFEAFDRIIGEMIAYFDGVDGMDRSPITFAPEGAGSPNTLLSYPGKVLADVDGGRLFIADSNNHRIVVADLTTYEVLYTIGSGQRGYREGDFATAAFNKPQGMALHNGRLYVADTNNHAVRVVDLTARTVDTLAGTGEIGTGMIAAQSMVREPRAFTLRSPWDVAMGEGETLYIAMAGTHQIWEIDLSTNVLRPAVGNGREALLNLTLTDSELAQPSGLHYHQGMLYFADSESSSIRVADTLNNQVRTVSGPAQNSLFEFGDVDGAVGTSRLQHPLGVTGGPDGMLYITDTYNSRIKRIEHETRTTTIFGLEQSGYRDGGPDEALFNEPGGLDYAELPDGRRVLFVADTNNHVIRLINLDTNRASTITFPNPQALQIDRDAVTVIGGNQALAETLILPEQAVSAGAGSIVLRLTLPDGYRINALAPSAAGWQGDGTAVLISPDAQTSAITAAEVRIPVTLAEGPGRLYGSITLYYCEDENQNLCFIDEVSLELPVSVAPAGGFERELVVERRVIPPVLESGGFN